jgi:uridylate kinase
VVFGGGTGHPFFTTDTTAALRAVEIGASVLLKGSKVDGIYSADPKKVPDAKRFDFLTYDEAVAGRYGVMDATAFPICRDHQVLIRVFDMTQPGAIATALGKNPQGTVVGIAART